MSETIETQPQQRRSLKPQAIKDAVLVKAGMGLSKTQIAEDLHINRNTVRAILSQSEMTQHVNEIRSDIVLGGDLWKARRVMRTRLNKGSESAAVAMLRGFNVLRMDNNLHVSGGIGVMLAQVPAEWMQGWEKPAEVGETTTTNGIASTTPTDIDLTPLPSTEVG